MDNVDEVEYEWIEAFRDCSRFDELREMQTMMASANQEERHMAITATDPQGNTALHMAAANGHVGNLFYKFYILCRRRLLYLIHGSFFIPLFMQSCNF
jgi:hypothetical protein